MPIMTCAEADAVLLNTGILPQVSIDLATITWCERGPTEDPRARLCAILAIGGTCLHIDAYEAFLENTRTGDVKPLVPDFDEDGETMFEIFGGAGDLWEAHSMEGAAETIEIEGRRYAVFMHPFCT